MFSQHRIFCFLHLISGNGAKTVFTRDFYIQDKVNTDYDNISHYLCCRCPCISFCAHFVGYLHLKKAVSLAKNISENVFPSHIFATVENVVDS